MLFALAKGRRTLTLSLVYLISTPLLGRSPSTQACTASRIGKAMKSPTAPLASGMVATAGER